MDQIRIPHPGIHRRSEAEDRSFSGILMPIAIFLTLALLSVSMRLTWFAHSCFLLEGSRKILIDPFFPEGVAAPKADLVALTHGHDDHAGEVLRLRCKTVAINETAKILARRGLDTVGMNIGGTISVDGVTFTMTQAIHTGGLELDGEILYGGGAAGYVIGMDGLHIYHAGDTALFSDMQLIQELYRPDVAMLPIGNYYTMGPTEAMMAARFIGAPLILPMHYSTWPKIEQDPVAFKNAVERTTDLRVVILKPGESLELDAKTLRPRT
jgi:L-ascorbate metabolism protein UlaG (beta-lactamase superfamily)